MIHEITITKQKSAFYRTLTNFESEYIKKTNRAYLLKTFETILNKPCDWEDITDVFLLEFKNTLLNNLCSNSCRTIFAELRSLLKTFSFFREIPAKQYEVTLKCKKEGTLNIYLTNNEIKSPWLVSSSFFASSIAFTKKASVLWSASVSRTSGTEISRITFIPPLRSRPNPI